MIYIIVAASIAFGIGCFVWRAKEVERQFWKVVRDNPDSAWFRFVSSADCFVDETPGPAIRGQYAGPYKFATTDGAEHSVFIFSNTIDEIYIRVARQLLDEDASLENRRAMRKAYEDDPRGAGVTEFRSVMRDLGMDS
jgi:hypothetical protein